MGQNHRLCPTARRRLQRQNQLPHRHHQSRAPLSLPSFRPTPRLLHLPHLPRHRRQRRRLRPPLDGSSKRDLDGLITAIINPDAATEHVFRLYRITRKDGSTIEGFKRSETTRDITILSMGGTFSAIPIADIKSAGYINGKSVMPNLAASMPDSDVAAIVKWLLSVP